LRRSSQHVVSATLLAFLGSACAFGDRRVRLEYPPPCAEAVVAVPASAPLGARTVHPGVFVDQRAERGRVGEVRNG